VPEALVNFEQALPCAR